MKAQELLPNLFKVERKKIISELRYLFAIEIEMVEDLVSDTFLSASEFWKNHGIPEDPTAWLHTVLRIKPKII